MTTDDDIAEEQDRVEEQAEMFRGRLLSVHIGLWSALSAVAGLLLGAAAILAALSSAPRRLALLCIVGLCCISLFLLVFNFISMRITYRFLGASPPDDVWTSPAAKSAYITQAKNHKEKVSERQSNCERREQAALVLLTSALFLIAYVITTSNG